MLFNYIPGTNQALIGTDNTPLLMYDDQTTLLGANNDGITDAIGNVSATTLPKSGGPGSLSYNKISIDTLPPVVSFSVDDTTSKILPSDMIYVTFNESTLDF